MTDPNASTAGRPESQKGDPLVGFILDMVEDGSRVLPQDVAKAYFAAHRRPKDPEDGWRRYMNPVKQQMAHMARQGLVELVRKRDQVVDPTDFRGVVRIRKPLPAPAIPAQAGSAQD